MTVPILAPDLDRPQSRILKAVAVSAGLSDYEVVETWAAALAMADPGSWIVSAGKAALDQWHQWGLVQVGAQRGQTFHHDGRYVMVIEHPGTLMQQSMMGHDARKVMRVDLAMLAHRLQSDLMNMAHMTLCGRCQRTRVKGGGGRTRIATRWVEELDDAGLCEECYRKRGTIKSRWKKPRVNAGAREAQIKGQREMFAGDGTRVVVRK